MRILDIDNDCALKNIGLYLTTDEARQMLGYLEYLLNEPDNNHAHLNDNEYEHEITISIYTPSNISFYDDRSRRLILEGR